MGRHIDHRGGDVNMLAFDQELIIVACPREDDYIVAYNVERDEFPGRSFSISEYLTKVEWADWFQFISNKKINEMVRNSQGDWGNYIKAAALRLQVASPTKRLKGINMFIAGKIPQAAGLSSSSALVVGTLEALMASNQIPLMPREFIDLCGEGEWFVGTRGGSSDHAAIKMSGFGKVTKIGFYPFEIKDTASLPEEYDVVIIDSQKKATKSKEVLKKFNEKVFCYEVGFALFKEKFPQYEAKLQHLRDINPEILNVPPRDIYSLMKSIPERIKFEELSTHLHAIKIQELREKFSQYSNEDEFPLRNTLLYGITECIRSQKALILLKDNQIDEFGRLMSISHDGDRVVSFKTFNTGAEPTPFLYEASDSELEHYYNENTPLEYISGSYGCSIPEIDFIVDFLNTQPGVIGSQLSGAGFGGCVMALIKKEVTASIIAQLIQKYQDYWHIRLHTIITRPIQGASVFFQADPNV
jgi:N-acetylgalactosamine kinase